MEDQTKTGTLTPEQEIAAAQATLAAAKAKQAEAMELKLAAARSAILQRDAEEARKRTAEKAQDQALRTARIQKRAEEEARIEEQKRAAEKEKLDLENQVIELELQKQKNAAHEKSLEALKRETEMIEQATIQTTAEALRMQGSTLAVEDIPMTIMDARHPLARILNPNNIAVAKEQKPVAYVDPVPVIAKPRLQPEEYQETRRLWFELSGGKVKITDQQLSSLQSFSSEEILAAAKTVHDDGRYTSLGQAYAAIQYLLGGSSLDVYSTRLRDEAAETMARAKQ